MNDTGVSAVHKAVRVISRRSERRVGHTTSGKSGQLAAYFVFPRVRFQEHFLSGAPSGSRGKGGNSSGRITSELFVEFLKLFQAITRCDIEHSVLLLLNNYKSHCSLAALQFFRNNGICSHRLQPLHVGVLKPLKTALNEQFETFMRMNPGHVIRFNDIQAMVSRALELSVNEVNIKNGLRATGIWLLDAKIFGETDFMPSTTTDRENPNVPADEMHVYHEERNEEGNQHPEEDILLPHISILRTSTPLIESCLESLIPIPKAPPRSQKKRGRPQGRTSILTSDAELETIAGKEKAKAKEEKKKIRRKKKQKEKNSKTAQKERKSKNKKERRSSASKNDPSNCYW